MIDYNQLNETVAPKKTRKPHSEITRAHISEGQRQRFQRLKVAEALINNDNKVDTVELYFDKLKSEILHDLKRISSNLKIINSLCHYRIQEPANHDIVETITNQAMAIVKNELNKLNEDGSRQ